MKQDILRNYLDFTTKQFEFYKFLGEKAMEQIDDDKLFFKLSSESNSISIIVQHLWGNMLSRWTDFLTTDGEKNWRERDAEFEDQLSSKNDLMSQRNEGWDCLLKTLGSINVDDLNKIILI